jgi:hypothetical protein
MICTSRPIIGGWGREDEGILTVFPNAGKFTVDTPKLPATQGQ